MIGSSIVGAMEASLLGIQATRVVVMPLLALFQTGKEAGQQFLSCDELRAIIRAMPSAREESFW